MTDTPFARYEIPRSGPIVGRDAEVSTIRACLEESTHGHGRLVLVAGEAGIGKTALVGILASEAEDLGCVILSGACYDLTATPPYGPWQEITQAYHPTGDLPALPKILAQGTGMDDIGSQVALFELVRDFMFEVASVRPFVIILEDIHWSDPGSLSLLRFLARQLEGRRMLIVATYRDDEFASNRVLTELLPLLAREARAARIDLQPIDEENIRELISIEYDLDTRAIKELSEYLTRYAEGNPLYLYEILRSLEEERRLRPAGNRWALGDLSQVRVPQLLMHMFERRMERIGPEYRSLFEIAAVVGHEVEIDLWKKISSASDEDIIKVVERCIALNVLTEGSSATTIAFTHSIIREAAYQRIVAPRRRQLHVSIADTLMAESDPDADTIAYHLRMAGDIRAVEWLILAGELAHQTYALRTAADRYAEAADMLRAVDTRKGERGWLLYRAARQVRFSDLERGITFLEKAEGLGRQSGDDILVAYSIVDRGFLRGSIGDVRQALNDIIEGNQAIDKLPPDHFQSEFVRNWIADVAPGSAEFEKEDRGLMGQLGGAFNPRRALLVIAPASVGLLADAISVGEPARAQLESIEDPDHHLLSPYADICHGLAVAYAHLGKPEAAKDAFDDARRAVSELGHYALLAHVVYGIMEHVVLQYYTDQLSERRTLAHEAERIARQAHELMLTSSKLAGANAKLKWLEGRWDDVEEWKPQASDIVILEVQRHAFLAQARIERARGNFQSAWRHIDRALPDGLATQPRDIELHPALDAHFVAAELALDEGKLELARAWLDSLDRWLEWSGAILGQADRALLNAKYQYLSGDVRFARSLAREALSLASDPRQPLALITTLRFLGKLSIDEEKVDEAKRYLRESLAIAEACAAPFEVARTNLIVAEALSRAGETDAARNTLEIVARACAALGANPTLDRANQQIASLSGTRARSAGLTRRELDVLRLVAQGMTDSEIANELYISRRTVNTHLTAIFGKLKVSTRTAAALLAKENNLV